MKKNKLYLGIDPGSASGCIAFLKTGDEGDIVFTHTVEFSKKTTKEWYTELSELGTWYSPDDNNTFAILEKVHGMPGMGVASISAFMKNVGHIEMALISLNIPFREITPQTWMKYYGMKKEKDESKTDWKRRLREQLQRLMPDFTATNDTADAMLIAYYAFKTDI
jgi:Holliday junction resolvasome RuvABC endonuclease subunit